jgi:hypothetical protein
MVIIVNHQVVNFYVVFNFFYPNNFYIFVEITGKNYIMKKLFVLFILVMITLSTYSKGDDIVFYSSKIGVYNLYNEYINADVYCLNVVGDVVFNMKLNSEYSIINLSALPSGIYTIKIVTQKETIIKRIKI